jgi:hypothetical protein
MEKWEYMGTINSTIPHWKKKKESGKWENLNSYPT